MGALHLRQVVRREPSNLSHLSAPWLARRARAGCGWRGPATTAAARLFVFLGLVIALAQLVCLGFGHAIATAPRVGGLVVLVGLFILAGEAVTKVFVVLAVVIVLIIARRGLGAALGYGLVVEVIVVIFGGFLAGNLPRFQLAGLLLRCAARHVQPHGDLVRAKPRFGRVGHSSFVGGLEHPRAQELVALDAAHNLHAILLEQVVIARQLDDLTGHQLGAQALYVGVTLAVLGRRHRNAARRPLLAHALDAHQ